MTYIRREYPQWCWSQTRDSMFKECKRKYFYHYYGAHNGWEYDAPPECRKIYRLKKLVTLHAYFGSEVHSIVNTILTSKTVEKPRHYIDKLREGLNQAYILSKKNKRQWEKYPNKHVMLKEMYYKGELKKKLVGKIEKLIDNCIHNIFDSGTYRELQSAERINARDIDEIESFNALCTKIFAVPDLVYWHHDGSAVIVDWKTGRIREDKDKRQLEVYAFYFFSMNENVDEVTARLEYLANGGHKEYIFVRDDLPGVKKRIAASLEMMKEYLADSEKNKPLPEDEFPVKDDIRLCSYCNFEEIC